MLTSPEGITITRLSDGRYLEVNQGFVTLSGYQPEEVIGRTSLELGIWMEAHQRPGILPENLKRIFDLFFTTKPTGHGLGLAPEQALLPVPRGRGRVMVMDDEALREVSNDTLDALGYQPTVYKWGDAC